MKKLRTMIFALSIAAMAVLSGCGDSAKDLPINTYTAESGMYSVSLPGEWKEEDNSGLADMLSLARDDGAGAIVMGMTKGQLLGITGSDVENLEDFFDYVDGLFLNGPAASTVLSDTDALKLGAFTNTLAKEGTMTQTDGAKGKIFVQCAETDGAYYVIMLSSEKKYDKIVPPIKEKFGFEELDVPVPETLSDTLRWFNASYALITTLNGGNLDLVAGYEPSELLEGSIQEMLERDWDITDKATLEESLDWLLTEGHNQDALDYLTEIGSDEMSRDELMEAMDASGFTTSDKTVLLSAYDAKTAYGDNAIAGWDLSRAMSLVGWGYLSGYYTYEEAMDKSMELAQTIQQTFGSWEDFMESYFYGYSYWSEEDPEDAFSQASERRQLYEDLKADGVYSIDWNTQFTKDW